MTQSSNADQASTYGKASNVSWKVNEGRMKVALASAPRARLSVRSTARDQNHDGPLVRAAATRRDAAEPGHATAGHLHAELHARSTATGDCHRGCAVVAAPL
jgi:hypothetical protein